MVIWLIGLSGAGKTTIGRHLHQMWKATEPNTVFIDGDEIREVFKHNTGTEPYTVAGRRANAERMTELCAWLDSQDINVVCCILSLFPEMRETNSQRFSSYFEAYVSAPMDALIDRDGKGLYAAAINGKTKNVVGIDIDFPAPVSPDIVIHNEFEKSDPKKLAANIFSRAVMQR